MNYYYNITGDAADLTMSMNYKEGHPIFALTAVAKLY